MTKFKLGLHSDISNADYHAQQKPEDHFYSSSQLKDMLEDPEMFHKKYILGEIERESNSAFDIGTYYHTAILEPHLLTKECAVWPKRRAGKEWLAFKEANEGKAIITSSEKLKADILIKGTKDSPIAMDLINRRGAVKEQSLFVMLEGVRIKVRFDYMFLSKEESYIGDLKSTTGSVKDKHKIRTKISAYTYDLSAALYVDAVNEYIRQNKLPYAPVDSFYWNFATKDHPSCKTWQATEQMLEIGRAKYKKALSLINKCIADEWQFYDEIGFVEAQPWEVSDWLEKKTETPRGAKFSKAVQTKITIDEDLL